ncbi:undecaprenyl-phosphate glucose phosphotransferase [Niveispirillum irakense]|uniref:undecaprenyl-phosphate glucose phosphotransferase n=1 Tax=Niveispirillum irakense TaxID=34011 RepID=UPI00048E6215|nr:undecaprenyl-phosphate glucose phosphotransferase [Niveispirillum irakense]
MSLLQQAHEEEYNAFRMEKAWSQTFFLMLVQLADIVSIVFAAHIALFFVFGSLAPVSPYILLAGFGGIVFVNIAKHRRSYTFDSLRHFIHQVRSISTSWMLTLLIVAAIVFFTATEENYARLWIGVWATGSLGLLIFNRAVARSVVLSAHRAGRFSKPVVLIGNREDCLRFCDYLNSHPAPTIRVIAHHILDEDDRGDGAVQGQRFDALPSLVAWMQDHDVGSVLLAMPHRDEDGISSILTRLRCLPVDVDLIPDTIRYSQRPIVFINDLPTINMMSSPLPLGARIAKRSIDILLSGIMILMLSPIMIAATLAIRLESPGPIIFRQGRSGFNNRAFTVYKFRTMRMAEVEDKEVRQAQRNDPRVTRCGRIMRRLSIDELPQLFNVLKGDMSLVGPRPHAVAHTEKYSTLIDTYLERHKVKPGITGWAQVNGLRGETRTLEKMARRVEYDLHYVENWSILLDVKILFLTALRIIDKEAY